MIDSTFLFLWSAKKAALWPMLHPVLYIQCDPSFENYLAILEKLWTRLTVHLSQKRIICPSYYRHFGCEQIPLSFDTLWVDCAPPSRKSDSLLLNCAEWLFPMPLLLFFTPQMVTMRCWRPHISSVHLYHSISITIHYLLLELSHFVSKWCLSPY